MLSGSLVFTSVQKDRLKNFPENIKKNFGLLGGATFISLVIWQTVRFQENICLDFVMKEHQRVENIHDNELGKDGMYGKERGL